ncbi:helix-turn-helix domain-containing protein [Escherichia coli]|uniref:helix-turn-helix domain-containing protein n=2 Tax=Escherichia coli TaxID=562 RepID=UPI0002B9D248|nr:helix-turn-helix domain-containing protein [Escherichia coli]ATB16769.1 AraC family transcriptional regulator [Escherichia coli]EGE3893370.1 AraC family transcriptional regulator [Escherichia coli]EMV33197.1 bacterial regulatory helix-turn-helix s, AraC family protein [Escherichia coli 2875000]EMV44788.1 bacterial regulatory helix-turn-helix s, AraC family protein [Escherichia coli 2872800]EMV56016.1 bacterial regulatory helix-turn-helix s, AraC family protein [Escherichia coli 2867750]
MIKEATINSILKYIDENIEVFPININVLVKYSGYSRRYLQLLFKEIIGLSIGKYIQRRRVTRAAIYLRLTNLPIAIISEKLCYDSQQTFSREFKKNSGYTPLQFRRDDAWLFKNQIGHRHIETPFPIPELCYLPRKMFAGTIMKYKEKIPYTSTSSKIKWGVVQSLFSQRENTLFISNKITQGNSNKNEFVINSIIWKKKDLDAEYLMEGGIYALFRYAGNPDGYSTYINSIYLNVLPFYGLQKRNTLDLEIISIDVHGYRYFEYYLPIEDKDIDFKPERKELDYP